MWSESSSVEQEEVMDISKELDTSAFLKDIHPGFLEKVEPLESGLVDHLRSKEVFSSDEEHLIRTEATRRDKARKLWKLLNKVSPKKFEDFCYPFLEKRYPHVVAGRHLRMGREQGEECVRHLIRKRVNLHHFADLFPSVDGCTDEEYCSMTEHGDSEEAWNLALGLCQRVKDSRQFVQAFEKMLLKKDITVPNLRCLMETGILCTCQTFKQPTLSLPTVQMGKKWLAGVTGTKRGVDGDILQDMAVKRLKVHPRASSPVSSGGYPSTHHSSARDQYTQDDIDSSASVSSYETAIQPMSDSDNNQLPFESIQEKESLLKDLKEINDAIYKASKIRPLFKQLDGIKGELTVLWQMPETESRHALSDIIAIKGLAKRSKDLQNTLVHCSQEAAQVRDKFATVKKTVLLKRHHMLINEIRESADFVNISKTIYLQVCQIYASARRGNAQCHKENVSA